MARSGRSVELHIANKRWKHDVQRKRKKADLKSKMAARLEGGATDVRQGYRSRVLEMLASQFREPLPSDPVHSGRLVAPRQFSLHHNPQETLLALARLAKASRRPGRLRIWIDLGRVEKMDLAADSLLAIVLKEIKNECFNVRRSTIRGVYPRDHLLRREMEEVGTVKVLQSEPGRDNIELSFNEDVKVYRHRETGLEIERTYDAPATVEKVTSDFADHVNRCLNTIGYELNELGRRNLCKYIGEALTNAQEHAGVTDWTIVGYLDVEARIFKFAIMNFGKSIDETFSALPSSSFAWSQQVGNYVDRHELAAKKKGLSRGGLITVAALQGKVSSKNVDATSTRGQGTVEMIEFFQRIYDQCSGDQAAPTEMALISGSTCIAFDGRYQIKKDERTNRNVIAFNSRNDLQELPDVRVVRTMLGFHFPGTIVSISFPLTDRLQIREIDDERQAAD